MRLPQGQEEGHSSGYVCLLCKGQEDGVEYIHESGKGQISFSYCLQAKLLVN